MYGQKAIRRMQEWYSAFYMKHLKMVVKLLTTLDPQITPIWPSGNTMLYHCISGESMMIMTHVSNSSIIIMKGVLPEMELPRMVFTTWCQLRDKPLHQVIRLNYWKMWQRRSIPMRWSIHPIMMVEQSLYCDCLMQFCARQKLRMS